MTSSSSPRSPRTSARATDPSATPAGSPNVPDEVLRALRDLAGRCGVTPTYTGQDGRAVEVRPETLLYVLRELSVDLPAELTGLSAPLLDATPLLPHTSPSGAITAPTVTGTAETGTRVRMHVPGEQIARAWVVPEDGGADVECEVVAGSAGETDCADEAGAIHVPPMPAGWHTLCVQRGGVGARAEGPGEEATDEPIEATLLIAPERLSTADKFLDSPATGVMAQLYSVRHRGAWGLGDYRTLRTLGDSLREMGGADFVLVNPTHAGQVAGPVEDSPYLPTTRRFTNPIYLAIEDVPEYAAHPELHDAIAELAEPLIARNSTADLLERGQVMASKWKALRWLYEAAMADEGRRSADLEDFMAREGDGLRKFARWCAEEARAWAGEDPPSARFFAWVQMLCQEQELAAQRALCEHMRVGLMEDLAVGVHPKGADATTLSPVLAGGASVGAPPDGYNQQGQDWSQPPWHPWKLAEAGYKPWRDMLRTILRTAGGIRIDHILGLFRLWWIPRGSSPIDGAYVSYDHEAMIGALILEAERAGAVVVGEDLGTFEPWVQEYLADKGILGTSVLWFEGTSEGPKAASDYRRLSLTSVTTHDLPPTASYLRGGHIALRDDLGVLTKPAAAEYAEDAAWQAAVLATVAREGAFADPSVAEYFTGGDGAGGEGGAGGGGAADVTGRFVAGGKGDAGAGGAEGEGRSGDLDRTQRPGGADGLAEGTEESTGIIEGLHRFLARTPSALRCVALVDMVGDVRAQNQPGTTQELYPNWRVPLCDHEGRAVLAEELPEYRLGRDVLRAASGLR